MTKDHFTYSRENGGRVLLLFLLFLLSLYSLWTSGIQGMAMITVIPFVILFTYISFRYRMFCFWALFVINYFLQMKDLTLPIPMSLPNEMLQLILLAISIVDARQTPHFERAANH